MRLNTPQQINNGRALLKAYGSWQAIEENSYYDHSRGVRIVAAQPANTQVGTKSQSDVVDPTNPDRQETGG